MARIVIALGGNALGESPEEQRTRIDEVAPSLVGLITQGHEIVISHGNGPQVGMIKLALDVAHDADPENIAKFELPEAGAMSQGYIGYHLQQGIKRELRKQGMPWHVATVITQTIVNKDDPAFNNPIKPVGAFYSKDAARRIMEDEPGIIFKEDAGRGWRQVVASPRPVAVVEADSILNLLDHEFIVIACGGGGVPVIEKGDGDYQGVPAVIDKDLGSAVLAKICDAEYLFILTAVDHVAINYGKPDEISLTEVTVEEVLRYAEGGHFSPGSMLPKIMAAVEFASSGPGRKAVIASLEKAPLAMQGQSGTIITL